MPVTVERHSDLPLLIATFTGIATLDDVRQSFVESDALIAEDETRVYRISDYRLVTADFVTAMQTIREIKDSPPGSPNDPRIQSIFLGTNAWTKMARDVLSHRQFGIEVAVFSELEQALEYIRIEMAK